jgi:uncharacterized protein (TIGR02265 family)
MPDSAELEKRLALAGSRDTVRGLFFNSVFTAIQKLASKDAEMVVRASLPVQRAYSDGTGYPAAEFLRLLWKAAEAVAPSCGTVDQAFAELGAFCMDGLTKSTLGRELEERSSEGDEAQFLEPLLRTLQPMLTAGERTLSRAEAKRASLLIKGDLLPPQFYVGLVALAFKRLRSADAEVVWDKKGRDAVVIQAQW